MRKSIKLHNRLTFLDDRPIFSAVERELFPLSPNKGEQARRKLLLAALEKIGAKGYDNASVREIAEAAGQNVAAIAYYFGTKDKLYAAVLEGIGEYLSRVFAVVAADSRKMLAEGRVDPEMGRGIMKRMMRTLLGEQLGGDFDKIRLVMLREQASPSENFDVLYEGTLRPLHELFTRAMCIATGEDPASTEVVFRAHAIFGQVLAFKLARTTLLRRLGTSQLVEADVSIIANILDQHVDFICGGLKGTRP